MRTGYGRGYYGAGQLQKSPRRRRNWFTIVAVLGLGAAVVWFLWPRGSPLPPMGYGGRDADPPPSRPSPPAPGTPSHAVAVRPPAGVMEGTAVGVFLKQLEDEARARGFATVKDYEDSLVASAAQLQAAGAKVVLAPHLQHLAARVEQ